MILALLAAAVLMADSATAVQADPAAPASPATTASAKKAADKLVCQKEAVIGTRLTTKKCRTASQIAERRREDRANLEKMQQISNPDNVR
jgi:invasion protein IalB